MRARGALRAAVAACALCAGAAVFGATPANAQSIEERFERIFGPPVGSAAAERAGRRPRTAQGAGAPAEPAEPPQGSAIPDETDIPLPTDRPDLPDEAATRDPEPDPLEGANLENGEAPAPTGEEPDADSDEALTVDPQPDDDAPEPEPEPADEDKSDGAEADESEPATLAAPAYVPPEKARTEPEPSATVAPPAAVTPAESVEAAAAVEDALLCEDELKARGVVFTVAPSISDGECGVLRPVAVETLSSGLAVEPATQMLCRTALALDIWVSDSVVPAAADHLDAAPLEGLRHVSTYVCRARASEANISEHSRGSAIDIGALLFEEREAIAVEKQAAGSSEDRFLAAIRRGACGPFQTVLGPGTDADHADHFHLDIAARSNGSTYCR